MKNSRLVLLTIICLFLISCVSTIPGEKAVILQNLSTEYFNIAENYLAQKNYSKAIENYKLSLRSAKNENLNQTKYQLARAYALNKNFGEAEDIFFDLYQQEKTNTILAESLAYCYGKNGKLQDSINIYKELYTKTPYQEEIAKNYYLLLLETKEYDEAKTVLEKFKIDFPESKNISVLEENFKKATEVPKETETEDKSDIKE